MLSTPRTKPSQKWLPFEPICAVYLEYIETIHFVNPYPTLLTFYVQYTKTLAIKSGFRLSLYVQYT